MKLRTRLFLTITFLNAWFAYGQTEVNYNHKAIFKTLQKASVSTFSALEEIILPDSLQLEIHGKFFLIKNSDVGAYKYIYVGRVNSCRTGGCSIATNLPYASESEYFDYFVLFDKDKTVQKVNVFNYQATHGQEITAKGWLKQFIGHDASGHLQVDKNIDAISGATISVYAITSDLEMKTKILNQL